MRAIQIRQHGGPDVMTLVELDTPVPGPGEVRVRHHAIGVNYLDTYHRTGLYPLPLPLVLGTEGAGVIDAVGANVTHLREGDRVAYVASTPGSYADARVLDADRVVVLPAARAAARPRGTPSR
jgi:NADPH2:quinone reductase